MKKLRLWTFTFLFLSFIFLSLGIASDVPFADVPFDVTNIPEPVSPPPVVRDFFDLDPFYQQWISVAGFPILASAKVSPYALKEVAYVVWQMIGHRRDLLKAMAWNKIRLPVIAYNEIVCQIPEHKERIDPAFCFFPEVRARASFCPGCLTVTANEENLLNYRIGAPSTYSVLVHEFAHALHEAGLNTIAPEFDNRLRASYNSAMEKGLWAGSYATSNMSEYWAEAVGSWFNAVHYGNPVKTQSALKTYDPALATLLTEVFGNSDWRYTPSTTRTHLPHLQGFNPQNSPIFQRDPESVRVYEQLKDPNSDGGGRWIDFKLYSPNRLSNLKQPTTTGDHTKFFLVNLLGDELSLYFVNADGTAHFDYRNAVGGINEFASRVGGIWLIKDHNGEDLAVFRAEEKVGRVLVTPTPFLITPGLSKVSGDNQSGVSGVVLENPFVIELRDENISVLEGISVTFTVAAGGGTLNVTRTTTDKNGRAESVLTLGQNPGTNTVSVSAAGIEPPVIFNTVAEAPVDFPPNLRAAVETALRVAPGTPIVSSEMETLPHLELEAINRNISDLTGLEHAPRLTRILLNDSKISDLSPLAGLIKLTALWLEHNAITDISALAGLTNLTRLELAGNNISDISAVAGLANLTRLGLWGNSISDISVVAGLTELIGLWLWDNNISDISPVASLTNLTWLNLNNNLISDLSSLMANTGLGEGDEVDVRGNPLSYLSIHTHIPILKNRGVKIEFDNQAHPALLKISGDNQKGVSFAPLSQPFVVEVQDANGSALAGVSVTFAVTAGGGTLSTTITRTDENGRAQSTLTLGPNLGTNTVEVSAAGIQGKASFHAISDNLPTEFLLSIPAGLNLIHVPLKVTAVDGVPKTIESVADFYDTLGGEDAVNFLITRDPATQGWFNYFGPLDKGTSADKLLTYDTGIMANMKAPVSIRLSGGALGTNGSSTITLHPGTNLVGLPLRDARIARVSDLFTLDGIRGNVPAITVSEGGVLKGVGRAGDDGDIEVTGGQSFILTAQRAATVAISGEEWYNTSGMAATPLVGNAAAGVQVMDTTLVLALRGSIVSAVDGWGKMPHLRPGPGFRVIVKNLSTGRVVATVVEDENYPSPDRGELKGVGYQLTIVDMETERAVMIGDILEISAQSPHPLIGVEPLEYTVTAEDVRQSWIQLPALVAYEIPSETELLPNYPNPFNPETWIPYRLAEDAFVTLTIYDLSGRVVRTLNVGHRIASAYENRSKAIHWNGRNDVGERVASGIYFYTLTAGDYSATRRMVILK